MPKLTSKTKKPPAKKASKKPAKPKKPANKKLKDRDIFEDDPAMFWSDEDDEQQELMVVMGEIGAGKTYFANSSSDDWPRGSLPAKRMTPLNDVFNFQCDRKAVAGLKGDNIKVRTFDVIRAMTFPEVYEEYGFKGPPSFVQATQIGLQKATEFADWAWGRDLRPKIIIDTLTGWDGEQFSHYEAECQGHTNQFEAFKRHGAGHRKFLTSLLQTGADLIFCCHQRNFQVLTQGDKDKAVTVRVAGMEPSFVPDLIGKIGPKLYKRHTTLQMIMRAYSKKVGGKRLMHREVLIGLNDLGGEAKNRYERVLPPVMKPDLRKILEMVRA